MSMPSSAKQGRVVIWARRSPRIYPSIWQMFWTEIRRWAELSVAGI
jgi:hypothetical protein